MNTLFLLLSDVDRNDVFILLTDNFIPIALLADVNNIGEFYRK